MVPAAYGLMTLFRLSVPDICSHMESSSRITVGAVVSTAHASRPAVTARPLSRQHAFRCRLADYTADRDSHPALKICGCEDRKYF